MTRLQISALFIIMWMPYTIGNALLPLLPIYTQKIGADQTNTGIYLGLSFGALAIGSLVAGWLSDRFQKRKLTLMIAAIVTFPVLFLMGQVNSIELLTVFTMIVWFTGGLTSATVYILVGIFSESADRGRNFGIIGIAFGLGAVTGGLIAGPIVDNWGYPALFAIVSLTQLVVLLAALVLKDRKVEKEGTVYHSNRAITQPAFWILIVAMILGWTVLALLGLGRPLQMDGMQFDATAISSTAAIPGLITMPLPFIAGWLSDRMNRAFIIAACFLFVAIGVFWTGISTSLGDFWFSGVLLAVFGAALVVGSAFVTDIVPLRQLSIGLAIFSASPWIGNVVGYMSGGILIQNLGLSETYYLAILLTLLGFAMVLLIRQSRPQLAKNS